MQQVKIFKSNEDAVEELEEQINAWIGQTGARIISITGNIAPQSAAANEAAATLSRGAFSPSDVVVFLLYETD